MREQNPQAAERRAKPVSAYRDFPTVVDFRAPFTILFLE